MSMTLAGIPLTQAATKLARSALPDAPVVPERRRTTNKDQIGRLLRIIARYELRLAERIAPMSG
jgi:hypothetical protein